MNELRPSTIACPYCGESIEVLIDCSIPEQSYIEDCQVCCAPIVFDIQIDHDGDPQVAVRTDSE